MSAAATAEDAPTTETPGGPEAEQPTTLGVGGRPTGRSIGPVLALGLGVAVLVGAIVVALVGGDDVSATAVRVNTFEVSQKTFDSQLRQLSPVLRDQGAPAAESTDAFVPTSSSAQLAQVYVMSELLRGHVKITDADRKAVSSGAEKTLARFEPDIRSRLVDVTAMQQKLVDDKGQEAALKFIGRLARKADVHVDPRYGIWNPLAAEVCAPTGCSTSTGSGG